MKKHILLTAALLLTVNSLLLSQTIIKQGLRAVRGGVELNGSVYFCGVYQNQPGLWKTDGTEAGTVMLAQVGPYEFNPPGYHYIQPSKITKAAGKIFYMISEPEGKDTRGLYCYNPADNSNTRISTFPAVYSQMMPDFVEFKGMLYFIGWEATYSKELWKTDGTDAGTVLVKDVAPGTMGGLMNAMKLTVCGNYIYFPADDASGKGTELWRSDGTEAGTVLVKDINPGSGHSYPQELSDANGTLYFAAKDGTHGTDLWKSDGTEAGTVMVKDLGTPGSYNTPSSVKYVNGNILFCYADDVNGYEMWKTDGTDAGTSLFKDINPGTGNGYGGDVWDIMFNGIYYFAADDEAHGQELWRTDGTEAGTYMVTDLWPGQDDAYLSQLTVCGNKIYFSAVNGETGHELWCTDGTAAGTKMLGNINADQWQSSYPEGIASTGSKIIFSASPDGTVSNLYAVDGTTGVNDKAARAVSFSLKQNYPNPFNPSTRINFTLPERSEVSLKVFDMLGKEVAVLVNGEMNQGSHTVEFKANHLASGLYLARLQSGANVQTIKMNLVK